MVPIKVWVTRPDAYTVYMRGAPNLLVWTEKPHYSHAPRANEFRGRMRHFDVGWSSQRCHEGVAAKPLLKQDSGLLDLVVTEVILSLAPAGTPNHEAALTWAEVPLLTDAGSAARSNWGLLFSDKDWESKCNVCHKRFLLEVELRGGTVQSIPPVAHWRESGQWVSEVTSVISPKLALEREHPADDPDGMPF
jgi:hypothetical protein